MHKHIKVILYGIPNFFALNTITDTIAKLLPKQHAITE